MQSDSWSSSFSGRREQHHHIQFNESGRTRDRIAYSISTDGTTIAISCLFEGYYEESVWRSRPQKDPPGMV
ncbi:hypothetical protein AAFF_G00435660 [Aldrovandia affinis]|uniref:Uncharacterized protein n=1 Tax=Aldrovandia affinis TaxID=143900 RepID=A0AAD7S8B9_9TELE|nr:hypothetical protein AAFF_G00435660 [Aldrovandia affinis]